MGGAFGDIAIPEWGGLNLAEILIVEDELPVNELICKNLKLTGHHCTQVFDGCCAMEILGLLADGRLKIKLKYEYSGEFAKVKTALLNISSSMQSIMENIINTARKLRNIRGACGTGCHLDRFGRKI